MEKADLMIQALSEEVAQKAVTIASLRAEITELVNKANEETVEE